MRNIVDDIIKKTIASNIQETITTTLPDLQSSDDNEFRSVTLDSDNNDMCLPRGYYVVQHPENMEIKINQKKKLIL